MDALTQISVLLISTFSGLYIGILWVRFLLQLVQADFYNPISQFVVKATAPVLNSLRPLLPKSKQWDIAALIVIVLLQLLTMTLLALIKTHSTLPPLLLVFSAVFQLLFMVAEFYFWLLLISVVMSWISPGYSPFSALINQLCEPLLAPLRRILPAMGGLDLSPIVAFLAIRVVEILLDSVSKQVFALVF